MKNKLLLSFCALLLLIGVKAQTTVTVTCTGSTGSYNSGSVNSAGTKNDGDMVTINSTTNRGWAKFDLSSLPASAIIMSANCVFTTYTSTTSGATNNLYGFVGDPASIAGTTLYTDCASGTSFNASTWTANATLTKALNATGVSFIQSNLLSPDVCIGFVRGSTNTYNIYGYPGTAVQEPQLVLTYSLLPACSGAPTAGTTVASNTLICAPQNVNLSLSGATAASGLTYQWQSSPNGSTWTSIPTATTAVASPSVTATTYYQCIVSCGTNTASSTPVMVSYGAMPIGGTTVASSTLACSGQAINLSLSGASSLPGLSYQWQSSPNGSTWSSVPTGTTSTISPTITTVVYYQSVLTCGTSTASSSVVQINLTGANSYATVPFLETFDNTWQNRCDNQNVPTTAYWASNPTTTDSSWRRQDAGATANWSAPTSGTVTPIGAGSADFHSYYASAGTKGSLDLYANLGTTQNYVLSFYMINPTGTDSLNVLLSTDGGSTFNVKGRYNVAAAWANQTITLGPVNSASCIVRFTGVSDFGNDDIGVDSVRLFTATCTTPPVAGIITGSTSVNYGTTNNYTVSPAVGNIQWYSSATPTGGLTPIAGATLTTQPITPPSAGIVYYTVIASSVGCVSDTSNSSLMVTVNFAGDNVCGAIPLSVGTSTVYYKPAGASVQTGEVAPPGTNCQGNTSWCNSTLDNSMWFTFVAPASGYVSAQSPGFDTQLAIWKATACGNLLNAATATLVAANDDDPNYATHSGVQYSSYVQAACLTPGATYYVQLDSYNAAVSTDSTKVLITDLGTLDLSFTGLAPTYCLPSTASASLTPTVSGGSFTINTDTTIVTAFTPSLTSVGTQTVNYSLFGCMSYSTTVVVNSPTVTSVASNTAICSGTSITFTASGASSYIWTPGNQTTAIATETPTTTTVYTVTGTSGACSSTSTVNIQVTPSTTVSITGSTIICAGQTTTLTATGATNYTWMPGGQTTASIAVTPTATTSYSVTGNNICGLNTASTSITMTNTAIVNVTASSATLCVGQTATLTASGSVTNFTWTPGGQTTASIVVTPTITTIYTVNASSSCGTASTTATEQVSACSAGIESFTGSGISVYPNPTIGYVTIALPSELVSSSTIEIYDVIGKLIIKESLINAKTVINTSLLQEGLYIYKVYDNNGIIVKTGQMLKAGQ